ncbi:hypothetical protein ACJX0J_034101, partial [Zea mays]
CVAKGSMYRMFTFSKHLLSSPLQSPRLFCFVVSFSYLPLCCYSDYSFLDTQMNMISITLEYMILKCIWIFYKFQETNTSSTIIEIKIFTIFYVEYMYFYDNILHYTEDI